MIVLFRPDQRGTYPKIPTAIIYDKDGKVLAWGQTAENMKLDGRIPSDCHYCSCFKLHLDEMYANRSNLPRLPPNKTAITVISDYLRQMHEYVLTEVKGFTRDQMRYCLTIPASWSPDAKRYMRNAAVLGGLVGECDLAERLFLLSEPEAALACFMQTEDSCGNIMICDAGGNLLHLPFIVLV